MEYLIYLLETIEARVNFIKENLTRAGYQLKIFSDLSELESAIKESPPELLILSSALVPLSDELKRYCQNLPVLIYGEQIPIETVDEYYRLGVRKVLEVDEKQLPELLMNAIEMLNRRLRTIPGAKEAYLTHGAIHTFSLFDLIENAYKEKKNLVVKVLHKGQFGRLRIFQGIIISAECPPLKDEAAVLKILQLSHGTFYIRSYVEQNETASIAASTLSLLMEARYLRDFSEDFLNKCGGGESICFKITPSPVGTMFKEDVETRILSLAQEHLPFEDIVWLSPFPVKKTLNTLNSFLQKGIISPDVTVEEPNEQFKEEDIQFLRNYILPHNSNHGSLIVLGLPSSGRSMFIRTISGFQKAPIKEIKSLEFTRIRPHPTMYLTIFGVSMDESVLPVIEKISDDMVACVFLIDAANPQFYEYTSYLINRLVNLYQVPYVVGVTNLGNSEDQSLEQIKKAIKIPSGLKVLPVKTDSFSDVRLLLNNLRNVIIEEEAH